ncbi:MAG: exodeoxyribonuclease VII large subunit, partial [Parvularculaceae bacterium]
AALVRAGDRLARVAVADARRRGDRLAALGAQLRSLSHQSALERGFAFVRGPDGRLIRRAADASAGDAVTLVFADGERGAVVGDAPRGTHGPGRAAPRKAKGKPSQGSLFERDG